MKHIFDDKILKQYASGELNSAISALVSSHLENCKECSLKYEQLINQEADQTLEKTVDLSADIQDQIFAKLLGQIENPDQITPENNEQPFTVDVSGYKIELPKSLSFLKHHQLNWKEFGKKNSIAPVSMSKEGNFYLIYIGPGESVPRHDHTGIEYSYVVAGSYEDGVSSFTTGDFTISSKGHLHSPKATSEDGCLVVSWVEGRLNYFNGIFKPLNSLLWWYLHRA